MDRLTLTLLFWCAFAGGATLSGCVGAPLRGDVDIDGGDGDRLWKLELEDGAVELEDSDSEDVAKYRYKPDAITFKDRDGRGLEVVRDGDRLVVRDRETSAELCKLVREPDGDWELESAYGDTVHELKLRDYGYKVEGAGGTMKVRRKEGKISVRDEGDNTRLSTRSDTSALSLACFACEGIPVEYRAGLCLAVERWKLGAGQ